MNSKYPKNIDLFETKINATSYDDPNGDYVMAEDINNLQDSITAIQNVLGTNPQGIYGTVKDRISNFDGMSFLRVPPILVYHGDPLKINGAASIFEAALEYLKYDHVVLQLTEDSYPLEALISEVKINRNVRFYGYIDCSVLSETIAEIQIKINKWKSLGVDGIYCGNIGYDFGVSRERQNLILDSVHEQDLVALLDANNPDDILSDAGSEELNPGWTPPKVQAGDIYHYKSFGVDSLSTEPYIEIELIHSKARKLHTYRENLGIEIFATSLIEDTEKAQEHFNYAHALAALYSFDAFYAASDDYGLLTNQATEYKWSPVLGSWYSKSPVIQISGSTYKRSTPFGEVQVDTLNHTYEYVGAKITSDFIELLPNTIEGAAFKDGSIPSEKIIFDGDTLIEGINAAESDATIDIQKIGNLTDETGGINEDLLRANILQAINAEIGILDAGMAAIGSLTAEEIETGNLRAGRISGSVISAINLYAASLETGHAKISNAVIGQLDAEHLTANVVEAINLSAEEAVIKGAKIESLDAEKISAGDISADRMRANVISAINMFAETIEVEEAKIDSAAIGELEADRIQASVIDAINFNAQGANIKNLHADYILSGNIHTDRMSANVIDAINLKAGIITADAAVIDAAAISELTADHIRAVVIEAIESHIGTATIDSAIIGELSVDHMVGNVVKAINLSAEDAVIDQAHIGNLNANKITSGDIDADRMVANVVSAINTYTENMTSESALIETGVIGELTSGHIKATVIDAINISTENIKINKGRIGQLDADNIEAEAITTDKLAAEAVTAEKIAVNTITAHQIAADTITAEEIAADTITANEIASETITANEIAAEAIIAEKIAANAVKTINLDAESVTAEKIATEAIEAEHISADAIESGHIIADAIQTHHISSTAITAEKIRASVIDAINFNAQGANIQNLHAGNIATGNIHADRMRANVVSAINIDAQGANIENLNADHISAGDIDADRMMANVVDAVNLKAGVITANAAKIDQAAIGELTADHIATSVIEALKANVGEATIDSALIGDLEADSMKANVISAINGTFQEIKIEHGRIGELTADHITTAVLEAINASIENLTANEAAIGSLTAEEILTGELTAERIRASVIEAINFESQGANIKDLDAENITAGDIASERMSANVIDAVNLKAGIITTDAAIIDAAAIGVITADHITVDVLTSHVIQAVNASIETIEGDSLRINKAKIGQLDADNIEANAITAEKILAGSIDTDHITAEGLDAEIIKFGTMSGERIEAETIHSDHIITEGLDAAVIKFGEMSGDRIDVGTIHSDHIVAEGLSAAVIKFGTMDGQRIKAETIESSHIVTEGLDAGIIKFGTMSGERIEASTINSDHIVTNGLDAAVIQFGTMDGDRIKAGTIKSDHIHAEGLDAEHIKFGTMSGERIRTNTITAEHIQGNTAVIDRILSGNITADDINVKQITSDHIATGAITTDHMSAGSIDGSVIRGDSIHGSKIIAGTLSASNLEAGSITSVEIAAQTIQTRNLAAGAVDARILRAGTITAEHISTVGLDANLIEVFGNDGQTLIGDGYLRVDGLDVGVVQSDNLIGNGLFLTASSAFGWLRDNPRGEAVLGSQTRILGSHQLWRIDTESGNTLTIDLGGTRPEDVAIDDNYEYIYVTLQGEDKMEQIHVAQGAVANRTGRTLNMGKGPGKIIYTGDALGDMKHFFVMNTDPKDDNIPDTISIVDGPPTSINMDLYVHHMIPVGNTPYDAVVRKVRDPETQTHPMDPHQGYLIHTFITLADQGDIAVVDMSGIDSSKWLTVRNIPIGAHMTDNYHGGLDGRFGLGVATGGDASSQYSDDHGMQGMHEHHHGGYGTSDGSMRTYEPHGIALSSDPEHIYVTDYANGHLLVVDIFGKAPYNALTGTRMAGNMGEMDHGMGPHMQNMDMITPFHSGHDHMGDDEPVHTPGFEGPIPQEEQTTRWVRYRIPLGDQPESIEVIDGKIFVTLEGTGQLAILDEQDILDEIEADRAFYGPDWMELFPMRELPTWHPRYIDLGARPTYMSVHEGTHKLYVTLSGQNQIVKIDVNSEEIIRRFNTGPNPRGIEVSPDGAHIYVVNQGGTSNLSFVYPEGHFVGDAYLGLEGGVEYHGAEHWVPNRSDWIYDEDDPTRVRSATTIEFHINEPFLNEGGFARMSSFGVDNQWGTIEQDIYNVVNYSNGNNVAFAQDEELKQDASLIRFWPKNEWLEEYGVSDITIYAKNDEYLRRDDEDGRIFYPSKNWIETPERPVILVGMSGDFTEVSENEYTIEYGEGARIVFDEAVPGDQEVYSSAYYYSEIADPTKYEIYYEDEVEESENGVAYAGSHIRFERGYLPESFTIEASYVFKHNRWFRTHNGSISIATENSSSENYYVRFEIDEYVPKFVTIDNLETKPFKYWPIEVPSRTNDEHTGIEYSDMTNRALTGTVTSSAEPILGSLDLVIDGLEPISSEDDHSSHEDEHHGVNHSDEEQDAIVDPGMVYMSEGKEVELPSGKQYVTIDLGATYMISRVHILHAFHKNRIYHETKTEVSQDGIHWTTIFDSSIDGEYPEATYDHSNHLTIYGKEHRFYAEPVRYIRDWTNGFTEYSTDSENVSEWTQDTPLEKHESNHWADIKAFGDWEFEKEFSVNYTDQILDKDIKNPVPTIIKGSLSASGGTVPFNIGDENEQDITRLVDRDLSSGNYFTLGDGPAAVTVDLGEVQKVDTIRVFRYYTDRRIHHGAKTEISVDGESWEVIYDSAVDGEYEESPAGKIISLGEITEVRYIRDTAENWTAQLREGGVISGEDIRWVGIHAYLDYNPNYEYVYQPGSELEGQNLATNGQGVTSTTVPRAFAAIDIEIHFTSWWYMTYIVGPGMGTIDVEMPTVMGGSHSMFMDAPYINKIAHRHIMSWPESINIKADPANNIKAGQHRAVMRHTSGKVTIDRFRFEDFQYLYRNSIEVPKGSATNFKREKIEPTVARWYVGRGNQSTEGAYDTPRINSDTGLPDGSVPIKYRFRIRTDLRPSGVREERGISYVTSAIFETGRLSSHWRMSQAQDSFPGNRIQAWDPNQPHKTGIQNHHLANGSVRGSKIMPYAVMDYHISPYALIKESKLDLNHPTHRHGYYMVHPESGMSVWVDNKEILDSIKGIGKVDETGSETPESGTSDRLARADHGHPEYVRKDEAGQKISGGLEIEGDISVTGTVDGVDISDLKSEHDQQVSDLEDHISDNSVHFTTSERNKLNGIASNATRVESSTNGRIKINGSDVTVYTHPTNDGNKHVPATGTSNDKKVLKAGSTAGSIAWGSVDWSELTGKPLTFAPPIATDTILGGVKEGQNITIAPDGTISGLDPYIHPTNAGNKHIPAGGTQGDILKFGGSSGVAKWDRVSWNEILNRPTHTTVNIDDAVDKKHSQNTDLGTDNNTFGINHGATLSSTGYGIYFGGTSATSRPYIRWNNNESAVRFEFYKSYSSDWAEVRGLTFKKPDGTEVSYEGHTHSWSTIQNKPTTFRPPIATKESLGGVIIGDNIHISSDGSISVAAPYIHPTTAGNKHVPSGGSIGRVLKYGGSSGTAQWGNVKWSEITSRPNSNTESIDDAVGKRHNQNTDTGTMLESFGIFYGQSLDSESNYSIYFGGQSAEESPSFRWNNVAGSEGFEFHSSNPTSYAQVTALTFKNADGDEVSYKGHTHSWDVITDKPSEFNPYIATATRLGGVKQGANVTIATDGTISVAAPYTHPTSAGSKHIPAGGATGQFLKYGESSGTAQWASVNWNEITSKPSTYTPPVATKDSLGGVKIGDNITITDGVISTHDPYVHPTGDGHNHIPAGGTLGDILKWNKAGEAFWGQVDWDELTNAPTSGIAEIDTAVGKSHNQNTDTGTTATTFTLGTNSLSSSSLSIAFGNSADDKPTLRWSGSSFEIYSSFGTTSTYADLHANTFFNKDGIEVSYNNHSHPDVTDHASGFMPASYKKKIDGIQAGAINQSTADERYLRLTGGDLSGDLSVDGNLVAKGYFVLSYESLSQERWRFGYNSSNGRFEIQSFDGTNWANRFTFPNRNHPEDHDFLINGEYAIWHTGTLDKDEFAPSSHIGSGGSAHALAVAGGAAGFISGEDKDKLNKIEDGANLYIHPTGDGNLHLPATGTVSNGKFLKAGSSAGSASWQTLTWSDITNKPSSTVAEIDNAVSKSHSQNTDTGTTNSTFRIRSGGDLSTGTGYGLQISNGGPYLRWYHHSTAPEWQLYEVWNSDSPMLGALRAKSFKREDGIEVSYADHTHSNVTNTSSGLMTSELKLKLDEIQPNAINQDTADKRYLRLTGGTISGNTTISAKLTVGSMGLKIGEGLEFLSDNNYFGTNLDARVIRMIDTNSSNGSVGGGIVIEGYTNTDSMRREVLTIRTNGEFKYRGNQVWDAGNLKKSEFAPASHIGTGGSAHALAIPNGAAGFISGQNQAKLDNIEENANNYIHPTGDGSLHVPATGTGNNGKVLKAGSTAGSISWGMVAWNEIQNKPTSFNPSSHSHSISQITGLQTALGEKVSTIEHSSLEGRLTFTRRGLGIRIAPNPVGGLLNSGTAMIQVLSAENTPTTVFEVRADGTTFVAGDLVIEGSTTQTGTTEVTGSYEISDQLTVGGNTILGTPPSQGSESSNNTTINGELHVTGDTVLGDSSNDSVTIKGDLEIEGTFKPKGQYMEVGSFPVYGIAGDPQFETASLNFESIVEHIETFNLSGGSCLPAITDGASRYYKIKVIYSNTDTEDSIIRIVQDDGVTEIHSEVLPTATSANGNKNRTWMSTLFTTSHEGDTIFEAKKNVSGALTIRYVEVVAYDYFA